MRCSDYRHLTDTELGGELVYVVTQIHVQILKLWELNPYVLYKFSSYKMGPSMNSRCFLRRAVFILRKRAFLTVKVQISSFKIRILTFKVQTLSAILLRPPS